MTVVQSSSSSDDEDLAAFRAVAVSFEDLSKKSGLGISKVHWIYKNMGSSRIYRYFLCRMWSAVL